MINFNILNTKIISLLILFIPLSLLTGPFIPDLLISIIALLFFYLSVSHNLWIYYKNIYSFVFFSSCMYLIIRSIFSDLPFESLRSSLFYFRFGLFSLAVWYIIDNNPSFVRYFGFALLIVFVASIIDGYYQYFNVRKDNLIFDGSGFTITINTSVSHYGLFKNNSACSYNFMSLNSLETTHSYDKGFDNERRPMLIMLMTMAAMVGLQIMMLVAMVSEY